MAGEGDAERLVVLLEARIRDFEKNMQKASGTAGRTYGQMTAGSSRATRQMESDFARSTARINQLLASTRTTIGSFGAGLVGGIFAGVGIEGAQKLIDASIRIKNALKTAGLEGENLSAVYGRLFQSAQRNAVPIESLVTLFGRLSLVQKELRISQSDLIKFTDQIGTALRAGGTSAQEASGALLQLTQALGGGIVRAEEFNSILEGAPTIAQAVAAGLDEAGGSVSKLRNLVIEGSVSSEAFFRAFQAGAVSLEGKVANSEQTISGAFVRLQNVLVDTATRFDDSTNASRLLSNFLSGPFSDAIQEVGRVISGLGNGPVADFIGWMNKAVEAAVQGAADIGAALGTDQVGAAFGAKPYIGETRIQDRINGAFAGLPDAKSDRVPAQIDATKPANIVKPISLDDYPISGGKSGGAKAAGKEAGESMAETFIKKFEGFRANAYYDVNAYRAGFGSDTVTRENGKVDKITSQSVVTLAEANRDLARRIGEFQAGISKDIGSDTLASFTEEQKAALTSIAYNYGSLPDRIIAAIKTGNPETVGTAIRDLGDDNHGVNRKRRAQEADLFASGTGSGDTPAIVQAKLHKDAVDDLQKSYSSLGQVGQTALDGLANALADGKIEGKELLQILFDVAKQLLSMPEIGNLFGGLFGGGGFKETGGGFKALIGYAGGTNSAPGGPAMVNERGGEIIDLPRGSRVYPHDVSMKMAAAARAPQAAQSSQPISLTVNVHGGSGDNHVRMLARQGAQEAIAQNNILMAQGGILEVQRRAASQKG